MRMQSSSKMLVRHCINSTHCRNLQSQWSLIQKKLRTSAAGSTCSSWGKAFRPTCRLPDTDRFICGNNIIKSVTPSISFHSCKTVANGNCDDGQSFKQQRIPTRVKRKALKESKHESRGAKWVVPDGRDTGVMIYNSLTKKKVPLILPLGRLASWYICGPTVYDHSHIGHACTYVRFDVLRRILSAYFNIEVVLTMGITDIDDKIIQRAKEMNVDPLVLARQFENDFHKDMAALKVLPPTVTLRVTEVIPNIIDYIQTILDNGCAYRTPSGSVYFNVDEYGQYGKLRPQSDEEDCRLGESNDMEKKNPRDFALWKTAKPGEPCWNSPWGKGRPGWHIECSTMASDVFGQHLDIHSGGQDLEFPHHENELAQSQAYFCCEQWGNYWLHSGHLHKVNETEKMSKSLKNTVSIDQMLQSYTANQFRMFCVMQHYRSRIEFSEESMQRAISTQQLIASFLGSADAYIKGQLTCGDVDEQSLYKQLSQAELLVREALSDDFDTPRAINVLLELVRGGNRELQTKAKSEQCTRSPGVFAFLVTYINRILETMGVQLEGRKTLYSTEDNQKLAQVLDSVVDFRNQVRLEALNLKGTVTPVKTGESKGKGRNALLKACDDLRENLALTGFQIKDFSKQSSWEVIDEKKQKSTDNFSSTVSKSGQL